MKLRGKVDVLEVSAIASGSGGTGTTLLVCTGPCAFGGLMLVTDGANDVTLNVYDNASSAAGRRLIPKDFLAIGTSRWFTLDIHFPIFAKKGIYIWASSAGTYYLQGLYSK